MSRVAVKHDLYDIIRSPVITEKSTIGSEQNRYTFKVDVAATKDQIRKAVKLAFGVDVVAVNTLKVKGKVKRFRGRPGKRADYKKAIIKVIDGQSIDVTTEI